MYDVRMPYQSIVNVGSGDMSLNHNMSAMAIHPRGGVFASWVQQQQMVSIFTLDHLNGTCHLLNHVKHHDEGVLGLRLGQETGYLRFHPHLLQLAIASREGAITVKGIRQTNVWWYDFGIWGQAGGGRSGQGEIIKSLIFWTDIVLYFVSFQCLGLLGVDFDWKKKLDVNVNKTENAFQCMTAS